MTKEDFNKWENSLTMSERIDQVVLNLTGKDLTDAWEKAGVKNPTEWSELRKVISANMVNDVDHLVEIARNHIYDHVLINPDPILEESLIDHGVIPIVVGRDI